MLCVSRRSLYDLLRFRFRRDATAAVSFSYLLSNPERNVRSEINGLHSRSGTAILWRNSPLCSSSQVPFSSFRSFTHGSGESASTPPLDRQSSALKQPPVSQSMSGLLQPTTCEVKIAILKLLIIRDFEWANLLLRFEQENHYCLVDVCYPQSEGIGVLNGIKTFHSRAGNAILWRNSPLCTSQVSFSTSRCFSHGSGDTSPPLDRVFLAQLWSLVSGHMQPTTPEVKITLLPQSNLLSLTSQQVGFMKGPSNLIAREVHTQPDPRILLLQAVSKLFEEHFEYATAKQGSALHSLVIKLGIEYQNHRNLITLYGRETDYRESVIKVVNMIDKSDLFYKSLTPMVHAFAFVSPRDSRAALGLIMKLGTPRVDSMSGFLLALQLHCLRRRFPPCYQKGSWVNQTPSMDEQKVAWAVNGAVRLSLHYKIPLFPRVMGGIIQLYTAAYMLDEAVKTLKELPSDRIDEYMITSIFDACKRIEDISTAASLIRILKEKGVKYRLNEVFKTTFAYHQMSEEFGDNVTFYAKTPGFSRIEYQVKGRSER